MKKCLGIRQTRKTGVQGIFESDSEAIKEKERGIPMFPLPTAVLEEVKNRGVNLASLMCTSFGPIRIMGPNFL